MTPVEALRYVADNVERLDGANDADSYAVMSEARRIVGQVCDDLDIILDPEVSPDQALQELEDATRPEPSLDALGRAAAMVPELSKFMHQRHGDATTTQAFALLMLGVFMFKETGGRRRSFLTDIVSKLYERSVIVRGGTSAAAKRN